MVAGPASSSVSENFWLNINNLPEFCLAPAAEFRLSDFGVHFAPDVRSYHWANWKAHHANLRLRTSQTG